MTAVAEELVVPQRDSNDIDCDAQSGGCDRNHIDDDEHTEANASIDIDKLLQTIDEQKNKHESTHMTRMARHSYDSPFAIPPDNNHTDIFFPDDHISNECSSPMFSPIDPPDEDVASDRRESGRQQCGRFAVSVVADTEEDDGEVESWERNRSDTHTTNKQHTKNK